MPMELVRAALGLTEGRFRDRAPTERCFPFFPFFKLPPLYLYVTLTRKVTNPCVRGTSNCKLYQSDLLNPTFFYGVRKEFPDPGLRPATHKSLKLKLEGLAQAQRDGMAAVGQASPVIDSHG